jgi:hypothetical protein
MLGVSHHALAAVQDSTRSAGSESEGPRFELAYSRTAHVIRTYACESAAMAFVRDVVVFGSHADAAQFHLRKIVAELQ